jgi:hypothetical protein
MKIQITKNEGDVLREYPYSSRPVERSTGIFNKKEGEDGRRGGIARDTAYGNKLALLSKEPVKSDEHKAIVPKKSSLAKKDNDIIFLGKEIGRKDAFSNENTFFSLNLSTEAVKDQYAIGKIVFDIPDQRTSKYREVQAYRLLPEPTLETYV